MVNYVFWFNKIFVLSW